MPGVTPVCKISMLGDAYKDSTGLSVQGISPQQASHVIAHEKPCCVEQAILWSAITTGKVHGGPAMWEAMFCGVGPVNGHFGLVREHLRPMAWCSGQGHQSTLSRRRFPGPLWISRHVPALHHTKSHTSDEMGRWSTS